MRRGCATASQYTKFPGIQELLQGVDAETDADDYPFPEGFKFQVASPAMRPEKYQLQMACSIADALGRDNRPTLGGPSNSDLWMGWKPLPILTEFYAQMPYVVMSPIVGIAASAPGNILFPKTALADVTDAYLQNCAGQIWPGGNPWRRADIYVQSRTATQILAQYQCFDGTNTYTLPIKLEPDASGNVTVVRAAPGRWISGNHLGEDGTAWPNSATTCAAAIGMPVASGSNWNCAHVNLVANRTATGGAGTATGEIVFNGDNSKDKDWRASCSAGIGSYALELANPYSIPIRLTNLRFVFKSQTDAPLDITAVKTSWPSSFSYTSQSLDTYLAAATPPLTTDAEGQYVLKPGERIVFYRNGTELPGPGGARRKPFGGSPDVSPLIAAGVYKVDLGSTGTAPDLNGYPGTWNVGTLELEVACRARNGTTSATWMPCQRMVLPGITSGYDANNCYQAQTNVPDGCQGAPGDLVYKQWDVRTFGVAEKLNLLQSRPACWPFNNVMPVDMGDTELRTNTYGAVGSGVLPNGSAKPYPNSSATLSAFSNLYGQDNTASTMPLAPAYLTYDTSLSALGQSTKVAFPGPNANNAMYGGDGTSGGKRQNIKEGELFWNYVGIPTDPNYPGTFPELMTGLAVRDNPTATNGGAVDPMRRDGTPRAMDLRKVLLAGPIPLNQATTLNSSRVGNSIYRGVSGWGTNVTTPTVDQLTNWYQNTIGDAINFHLCKDLQANGASAKGLKGLCLRDDVPFYDQAKVAGAPSSGSPSSSNALLAGKSLTQLYADLTAKQAQLDALSAPPAPPTADPDAATRQQYTADLATINAGIRGQLFWTLSWADVICQHFQVDSPAFKGKTANNGNDFKPGTINLNTASKEVLACLSWPSTSTSTDADGRPLPAGSINSASGFTPTNFINGILTARRNPTNGVSANRQGLTMVSELADQDPANYGLAGASAAGDLVNVISWLPQQATCRSDVFCAHIVLQGYKQDDFNAGPLDVRRAVVFYKRDNSGSPATVLGQAYVIPNQ